MKFLFQNKDKYIGIKLQKFNMFGFDKLKIHFEIVFINVCKKNTNFENKIYRY